VIKIVIADSQFIIRYGLFDLLRKNGNQIIEMCESRDEVFTAFTEEEIDVLIIDYNKVDDFSLEDLGHLKENNPATNILALSDYGDKSEVLQAIELGVLSFLTKDCDKREILDAIQATAKGEKFFCGRVIDFILEGQIESKPANCKQSVLTDRELQVVETMSRGLKAKDIAEQLDLSVHTVYTHQKNIMKKLGLNSSAEVMLYAFQEGLN